jgi:hypothetical protein
MAQELSAGDAPFTQDAQQMGLAWNGWSWDVKMGDFLNNGNLEVIQANGFLKGTINRWPWLQEMAMMNDDLLSNPANWPLVEPGDDISGSNSLGFFGKNSSGEYVNVASELGLAVPTPTRGIAMADSSAIGTPAYGSTVLIKTHGHEQIGQLDPGSGHDGYRSFQVRFGLGGYSGPVTVTIQWPDNSGALHKQTVLLTPGTHNLMLTSGVKEI